MRFDRAAEFLAACASGDTQEARAMLDEAKDTEKENGDVVADVVNCSNADGITALHQVRHVGLAEDSVTPIRKIECLFLCCTGLH